MPSLSALEATEPVRLGALSHTPLTSLHGGMNDVWVGGEGREGRAEGWDVMHLPAQVERFITFCGPCRHSMLELPLDFVERERNGGLLKRLQG